MAKEWADDFNAFLLDLGECPEGMSIERIDTNGHYEPGNVRWATRHEQHRNRTDSVFVEHQGQRYILKDYAALRGVNYKSLHRLVKYEEMAPSDAADQLSRIIAAS